MRMQWAIFIMPLKKIRNCGLRVLHGMAFSAYQFGHGKLHSVSKATADDLNSHLKSPSPLLPKYL